MRVQACGESIEVEAVSKDAQGYRAAAFHWSHQLVLDQGVDLSEFPGE